MSGYLWTFSDRLGEGFFIFSIGQDHCLKVRIPDELARYCIDKVSITIDGISLTIAKLDGSLLEFWITPHTFARTNLQFATSGQPVNVEVDILAKYVEKIFAARTGV